MKKVIMVIGIIVLIPTAWYGIHFAVRMYRSFFNPYLDREISGPVTLTPEWLDISPKPPLTAERQIQQVILTFAIPMQPEYRTWGVVLSDGTIAVPNAQLIDEYGNVFDLKCSGLDRGGIGFSSAQDLPKDRTYRSVRIKANKPIRLSNVHWKCWNQWDVS